MINKIILTLIASFVMININAQTTWKVDQAHSSISFSVSHLLISKVTGQFNTFDITAISNEKLENPAIDVTITTSSINTNNEMRDDHLKAADFFDVASYPTIKFISKSFEEMENGAFRITGNMTIKGITKTVDFKGKLNGIIDDPRSGGRKAGLELTSSINREAFGIGEGSGSIGEDVNVIINLEMNQQ